jgi:hypothetical protein
MRSDLGRRQLRIGPQTIGDVGAVAEDVMVDLNTLD